MSRTRNTHETTMVTVSQLKSRRYDSEGGTILVYGDRTPIFVPKLDFSVLPNFRKPRLQQTGRCEGQAREIRQGPGEGEGQGQGQGNRGASQPQVLELK